MLIYIDLSSLSETLCFRESTAVLKEAASPIRAEAETQTRKQAFVTIEFESTVNHDVPIVGSMNSLTESDRRQTEGTITAADTAAKKQDKTIIDFFLLPTGKRMTKMTVDAIAAKEKSMVFRRFDRTRERHLS